jgi:SAM-dependent methyltransferase
MVAADKGAFLSRLLARFQRAEPEAPAHAAADVQAVPAAKEPPPDPITIREWLWGPGNIIPGNGEHVLALAKPFGLTPAMSMLDAAAGLGGPARIIAEAFGTYVTALEADPELARRGNDMSVAKGMARRAPVTAYDPETFELRRGRFDAVLAREGTHAVKDKDRFLRMLIFGMKRGGGLVLTDFTAAPKAVGAAPALQRWLEQLPAATELWLAERYGERLQAAGFDVRIAEDITAAYRSQIVAGWDAFLHSGRLTAMPRRHLLAVIDEAERSMRLVRALESNALRMVRFEALAARPPG